MTFALSRIGLDLEVQETGLATTWFLMYPVNGNPK
jgi:hypothetical protein